MSQGIYITGGEQGSGKSVVVLGIMEMTAWSSLRPTILRRTGASRAAPRD